ncbi:MAG: hypothetical protein DI555_14170 [Novosphingobium pentaromativorans]|uniref:Uncharacterized protein n=1 Tax=Novosphingobium pentaromativorans TaxID=205844 RepID=A0A2W5NL67_9SPHN|nr:MAG: hypothetical protein DI555_14170 [Novosphingobium pentaromativorans]
MTMATTPDQLLAQRAELDKQIAVSNLPGLKAFKAALASGKVATLADDLAALLPQLASDSTMGTPFQQATALISVVRGVTDMFDREVERVQALADAQMPPAE